MQAIYMVLIIVGVIIGLMILLVLLETLTKTEQTETNSETINKTSKQEDASCGSGACSACSFQLFEKNDKKVKGESSCSTY